MKSLMVYIHKVIILNVINIILNNRYYLLNPYLILYKILKIPQINKLM